MAEHLETELDEADQIGSDDLEAEPDEAELADLPDDELIEDDEVALGDEDDVEEIDGDDVEDIDGDDVDVEIPVARVVPAEEEDEEDEEEEPEDEDVEASLDVILKERLVVADDEEEDEDTPETDDRVDSAGKVLPKQPDEFVCQSCFLVKHPSQLADPQRMFCRDCM